MDGKTHHLNDLGVDALCNDAPLGRDILEHLMEGLSLDLLALELCAGIVEIK